RWSADLLDACLLRQQIEQRRCETKFDTLLPSDLHHRVKQSLARNVVVGDDDFLDLQIADELREIVERAEDRGPDFRMLAGAGDVVSDGTDDPIAEIAPVVQFADSLGCFGVRPDDKRRYEIDTAAADQGLGESKGEMGKEKCSECETEVDKKYAA